ncbi:competence protein [Lentibacillus lipolyticus]|nr:competence protein [Lentibacillus lipolyticus]
MGGHYASPIYVVSKQTKAILTKDSAYYRSLILETGQKKHSTHSPEEIIDHTCVMYGSTLDVRRKYVRKLLRVNSKVPVPVIPSKGVYMLPTASSKKKDNVWLSYYHIKSVEQRDDRTYVTFHDGTGLYVNASLKTFDLQDKRTSQMIAKMNRAFFFGDNVFPWNPY